MIRLRLFVPEVETKELSPSNGRRWTQRIGRRGTFDNSPLDNFFLNVTNKGQRVPNDRIRPVTDYTFLVTKCTKRQIINKVRHPFT